MKCLFITTLGSRDISIHEEKIPPNLKEELQNHGFPFKSIKTPHLEKPNLRKIGHILYENFEILISNDDAISLPIIKPCIDEVLSNNDVEITHIYLISTNQKSGQEGKDFAKADTISIAYFLSEKYLPWLFENKFRKPIPKIKIIELNKAPNDYDEVLKELEIKLRDEKKNIEKANLDKIFVQITGGTPQLALGLILNSVRFFDQKVNIVYKSESAESAKQINVARHILEDYEKRALKRLADRYDFDAIARNQSYPPEVRKIAECVSYRLNFDFDRYKDRLDKCIPTIKKVCKNHSEICDDAQKIIDKDPSSLFSELYWNAHIKWERDECADYIQRIWRILEGILHYVISDIVKCSWSEIHEIKEKFEEWTEKDNLGKAFVEKLKKEKNFREKHGLNKIGNSVYCSINSMTAMLDYLSQIDTPEPKEVPERCNNYTEKAKNKKEDYKKIVEIELSMRKFSGLRNKCFSVHGFDPVSKEIIEDLEKENNLKILDSVKNLIKLAGLEIKPNYYDYFKEIILNLGEVQI